MATIAIRRAALNDLEQLAPLFDEYRQFYGQPSDLEAASSFLRERLVNAESVIFAATAGRMLGFTQLYPSFSSVRLGTLWILNDLFVAPEGRRKGIAAELLQTAVDFAREQGALGLTLSTALDNRAAQAAYRAGGWVQNETFLTFDYRFSKDCQQ